jgi:hypothetical protein
MLRGELETPEPLSDVDNSSAYWKWRHDIDVERRAGFELDRIYANEDGARRMARRIRGLG